MPKGGASGLTAERPAGSRRHDAVLRNVTAYGWVI